MTGKNKARARAFAPPVIPPIYAGNFKSFVSNWDEGLDAGGWQFYDAITDKNYGMFCETESGAKWCNSSVAVSPPYSLMLQTSTTPFHIVAAFRKVPYMDVEYMSLESRFMFQDVDKVASCAFGVNKFTGNQRYNFGVQYSNVHKRWRYWETGPFGAVGVGRWTDISASDMEFDSGVWYRLFLDGYIQSNYRLLRVDDDKGLVMGNFDLSGLPVPPYPVEAPSNYWDAHLRCAVTPVNKKLGAVVTLVDDVVFTVAPVEKVDWGARAG